ncbi:hypothetical protein L596_017530 [Steinernema carpocapsae]|uniref:Uncharacterized protein n=1 Tax=Steinernema carpocapsae TaxID=34508 RepID=A0A4U5N289_STECR|nr:hypothetical protein L596_017530 [Steinernema carpocapsae]
MTPYETDQFILLGCIFLFPLLIFTPMMILHMWHYCQREKKRKHWIKKKAPPAAPMDSKSTEALQVPRQASQKKERELPLP